MSDTTAGSIRAKACVGCKFFKEEMAQNPHNGMLQKIPLCTHDNCADPVDGLPLQAQIARTNPAFCGIQGKFFKAKSLVEVVQGGNPKGTVTTITK